MKTVWWEHTDADLYEIPWFCDMDLTGPIVTDRDRGEWHAAREQLWAVKKKLVKL